MNMLWPAVPQNAAAMERWLEEAREVTDNLSMHEQTLADLRSLGVQEAHPRDAELADLRNRAAKPSEEQTPREAGLITLEAQIESLEATIERERPYRFLDEQDAWQHDTLVSLCSKLVTFSANDPFGETVVSVEKRLEFSKTIRKNSITYYQDEWDEAIESIADREECPQYGGLTVRAQLGLVPVGRDPDSGLWEFWHVQTGEKPQRDESGRIAVSQATGLVFVLIPGGTFWMGAQASDPEGRNYDPQAESDENVDGRPVRMTLDAFILSKYELTQGQWQRFTGSNPSFYHPGGKFGEHTTTLLHPVEQVTWEDCAVMLGHLGLSLPTEAQWEYGCRAGTDTPWWTGSQKRELGDVGNLADRFYKEQGGPPSWQYEDELNDGFTISAPVGRYRANAFGLHDVIGNVVEWCLDDYVGYGASPNGGDGRRSAHGISDRVLRGGAYSALAVDARSADRTAAPPGFRLSTVGSRPARALDP